MALTRRQFSLSAMATTTLSGRQVLGGNSNPDVVVIGAGAAGLAATDHLMKLGKSVVCIEATDRSGGRVQTDSATFGIPFDYGAHWLHNGRQNPFLQLGSKYGFDIYRAPDETLLFNGNAPASEAATDRLFREYDRAQLAIGKAGSLGRDVAASSVVDLSGKWGDTVNMLLGAYEMGRDLDQVSCTDWYSADGGADWFCRQTFGALLRHHWRDVPVSLNTLAKKIDWSGSGVSIATNRGRLSAKAVIVTVSVGVLGSNGLRFYPALPLAYQDAFNGITMGSYNHVVFRLKGNVFGVGRDTEVIDRVNSSGATAPNGLGFLANVGGSALTYGEIGGDFGRSLEKQGKRASIAFVTEVLKSMLGSDVTKSITGATASAWGKERFVRGCYSGAKPGAAGLRKQLRVPHADRVFFAGEATHKSLWATVAGAHKEGIRVARKIGKLL